MAKQTNKIKSIGNTLLSLPLEAQSDGVQNESVKAKEPLKMIFMNKLSECIIFVFYDNGICLRKAKNVLGNLKKLYISHGNYLFSEPGEAQEISHTIDLLCQIYKWMPKRDQIIYGEKEIPSEQRDKIYSRLLNLEGKLDRALSDSMRVCVEDWACQY